MNTNLFNESPIVDLLFSQLVEFGVDLQNFSVRELKKVEAFCETKDCILWINNSATLKPVYINEYGRKFYGFKKTNLEEYGFQLYEEFLHPDHFDDVRRTVSFFDKFSDKVFRMTYLAKNHEGDWKWTYSFAKALNFTQNGNPEYVLALVFDIENLVEKVVDEEVREPAGKSAKLMRSKFDSLTNREVEILHLIADELTSHEIGDQLYIEASTVDTHRKHIIRKLGVKSSLGLVKYSLMFNTTK